MSQIESNVPRADEFVEGVETILSRQPESGFQIGDSSIWFVAGHTVDAAIYDTFDEANVYFLSIKKVIPPEL
jgi:hypothetical protein